MEKSHNILSFTYTDLKDYGFAVPEEGLKIYWPILPSFQLSGNLPIQPNRYVELGATNESNV